MRTRSLLVLLAVTMVGLPGCLEDEPRYPDGVSGTASSSQTLSGTGTSTATSSATATSTGPGGNGTGNGTDDGAGNGTNAAPAADLSASPVNGTAPLNVTFSLSGSDPDGDDLSWFLTFGDGNQTNGTTLPTSVVHQYALAGNFTATLRVVDPDQAFASASVDIAVTGGLLAPDPHCHRTPTDGMDPVYVFEGDGGTWLFVEANDIPGLQVENNHPSEATGQAETLGEHNALWEGCADGDQMVF